MKNTKILLGQIILNNDIFFKLKIKNTDFFDIEDRTIFEAIAKLITTGKTADLYTVSKSAPTARSSYIASLTNTPTTKNYEIYENEIIEESKIRKLRTLISEAHSKLIDESSAQLIQRLENGISNFTGETETHKISKVSDDLVDFITDLEKRYMDGGKLPGVLTGFGLIDEYTGGLMPERYWVIGGRPSDGKSALMKDFALNISRNDTAVGIISIESCKREIITRLFATEGRVNSQLIQRGSLSHSGFRGVMTAAEELQKRNIYIYANPYTSIDDVKVQIRRMKTLYGVKIVFIDYIQLIVHPNKNLSNYQRVSEISISLKQISRDLGITVVALAQLGRDAQERRPIIRDFKESGQIEQDADVIMMIHHDKKKDESWILVDKCRDGQCGAVPVYFNRNYVSFKQRSKE